ncbi:MAG: gamma-glutamylcyclotransferase family protein [Opitutaceae bacterium]|nr:gamma-glutamylcyclotransferase family protein [Opitutaceae bacterium]
MSSRLFVYGTLKRGCCNHHHLAGQRFIGPARTVPGYRLYDLGGYPGLAAAPDDRAGVVGEVWSVNLACLRELDLFEGVHEGLYRRDPVPLIAPFAAKKIDAYVSALPVTGRAEVGAEWIE